MAEIDQSNDVSAPAPKKGWRFYLGIAFFALFLICPAFIPFVMLLPISGWWQAAISAALAIGLPEVCALIAVALLGREWFEHLLRPIKRLFQRIGPPRTVSRVRYTLGLVMFCAPLIEGAIFLHSHDWRELYEGWNLIGALVWDGVFVASFFVLGGDFCDKIRALFVHDAKVVFKATDTNSA